MIWNNIIKMLQLIFFKIVKPGNKGFKIRRKKKKKKKAAIRQRSQRSYL